MSAKRTILVVDDNAEVRETLREVIAYYGFAVAGAENGAHALAYLATHPPPDLILLDLMMPVLDGASFRAAQVADPLLRDIPVVVLTAAGDGREIPGVTLVHKPFEVKKLIEIIRTTCGP